MVAVVAHALDFQAAGRTVSCLSYAGVAARLAWGLLAGVSARWRISILWLYATNSAVLTEPAYVLMSMTAVVLLIWAEQRDAPKPVAIARAWLAMFAAGLAYWVRYAGLFLIAALFVYVLLRCL